MGKKWHCGLVGNGKRTWGRESSLGDYQTFDQRTLFLIFFIKGLLPWFIRQYSLNLCIFRLILAMFRGGKMNNCLEEPLSPIVLFFVRSSRLFPHFRISTCINQKRHFPPLSNEGNEQTHLYGGIRRSRIPFSVHAFYRCSMQGERFTT